MDYLWTRVVSARPLWGMVTILFYRLELARELMCLELPVLSSPLGPCRSMSYKRDKASTYGLAQATGGYTWSSAIQRFVGTQEIASKLELVYSAGWQQSNDACIIAVAYLQCTLYDGQRIVSRRQ